MWKASTAVLLVGMLAVAQAGEFPVGKNYPYLNTLCRLLMTAKKPPIPVSLERPAENGAFPARIFMSALAEDEWYEEVSKAARVEDLKDGIKEKYKNYAEDWATWKAGVKELEKHKTIKKLDGNAPPVVIARAKLALIVANIKKIQEREAAFNNNSDRLEIGKTLIEAATGKKNLEKIDLGNLDPAVTTAGRSTACGTGAGGGTSGSDAGKAITNDMLCLCAAKHTGASPGADKEVCGKDIGGAGNGGADDGTISWTSSAVPQKALLQTITKACSEEKTPPAHGARELQALLGKFRGQVAGGANCQGSTAADGVPHGLGYWKHNGNTCTGSSLTCTGDAGANNQGPCVVYGLTGANENTIIWYGKFETALKAIEKLEGESE
ncbi:unnamed protein product, partial [Trypanosoma congolense IL3000]